MKWFLNCSVFWMLLKINYLLKINFVFTASFCIKPLRRHTLITHWRFIFTWKSIVVNSSSSREGRKSMWFSLIIVTRNSSFDLLLCMFFSLRKSISFECFFFFSFLMKALRFRSESHIMIVYFSFFISRSKSSEFRRVIGWLWCYTSIGDIGISKFVLKRTFVFLCLLQPLIF